MSAMAVPKNRLPDEKQKYDFETLILKQFIE